MNELLSEALALAERHEAQAVDIAVLRHDVDKLQRATSIVRDEVRDLTIELAKCLRPLTEQELREFVSLTDAEIDEALAAGRRDREREEQAIR